MPLRSIIKMLQQDHLKSLKIERGYIGDEDWNTIIHAIKANQNLREVHLGDNVGANRAPQLANALKGNKALTSISVISPILTREGEEQIIQALLDPPHPNLLAAQIWHDGDGDRPVSPLQAKLETMIEENNTKASQLAATAKHYDEVPATPVQDALRRRSPAVHSVLGSKTGFTR